MNVVWISQSLYPSVGFRFETNLKILFIRSGYRLLIFRNSWPGSDFQLAVLKATQASILFLGWKKGIFCCNIFIFLKSLANLQKKKIDFFFFVFPNLDPDFSLVAFLKLVFQLFRRVLNFCHHLMLSPSWDASQWHNIRKLRKVQLLLMINQGAQKLVQSLQIGNQMCHFVIVYVHFLKVWAVVSLKKTHKFPHFSIIYVLSSYLNRNKNCKLLNIRFLYMDFVIVIWKFVRLWSLRCRHLWF
jgi:hypothetical protein